MKTTPNLHLTSRQCGWCDGAQVERRKAEVLAEGKQRETERELVLMRVQEEEEAAAAARAAQIRDTEEQAALALAACEADLAKVCVINIRALQLAVARRAALSYWSLTCLALSDWLPTVGRSPIGGDGSPRGALRSAADLFGALRLAQAMDRNEYERAEAHKRLREWQEGIQKAIQDAKDTQARCDAEVRAPSRRTGVARLSVTALGSSLPSLSGLVGRGRLVLTAAQ
eukprot:9265916-Pyramimonas_sp.AAC.1